MVISFYKDGKIVGGQKKIASAAKPFDKITGEDFKALKRKKAMGGGMIRKGYSKGTHVTKEGKVAKKGLWYNIAQKKKRGEKKAKPGDKDYPTAEAIKKSQA